MQSIPRLLDDGLQRRKSGITGGDNGGVEVVLRLGYSYSTLYIYILWKLNIGAVFCIRPTLHMHYIQAA